MWNGVVYVSSSGNGRLYAFGAATGTQLWTTLLSAGPVNPPTMQNGLIYVANEGGSNPGIYALDAVTGAKIWDAAIATPQALQAPAVANEIVYVGGDPPANTVFAYDAVSGALMWSAAAAIDRSATVANGLVYWGNSSGVIRALDAISGKSAWTRLTAPTSGTVGSSPVMADGTLYVAASNKIFALDGSTGKPVWSTSLSGTVFSASPAVANGVVFVCFDSSTAGVVQALDAAKGTLLWSGTLPLNEGFSSPVVAHGVLCVGGSSGLHAYRLP